MKLNVLLAVTDTLRSKYKSMISEYSKFFAQRQGSFLGTKATYVPREGMIDDPSKRKHVKVITTVDEKFKYFTKEAAEFINALFSQEKTNGSGRATAELVIDGESWGTFNSLELLRLKSLLDNNDLGDMGTMLSNIPTRSDAELWDKNSSDEYSDRAIYQTPLVTGVSRTTEKEEYILNDPNLKEGMTYAPQRAVRTIPVEVGDYTIQHYSGQWSQKQRAAALKKKHTLVVAVTKALKECNDCEAEQSALTADKIFGYIFQ